MQLPNPGHSQTHNAGLPQGHPQAHHAGHAQGHPQLHHAALQQGHSQTHHAGFPQGHSSGVQYGPLMNAPRPYGQSMGMAPTMMPPMARPEARPPMNPNMVPMNSGVGQPMGSGMGQPLPSGVAPSMGLNMPIGPGMAGMPPGMPPNMASIGPPAMGAPAMGGLMGPHMAAMRPPHMPMGPMYGAPAWMSGYGMPPLRPTMPPIEMMNVPPPQTRQGSSEEIAAFYRRLKTLPPFFATGDQDQVRLDLNVQSAALDKVAMSRYLFAVLRRKRYLSGKSNIAKSSLINRGPHSSPSLNCLVPVGLKHTAAVQGEVLQNEAMACTEELTRSLRHLPWFTLSPFHPMKAFYNYDRSLGVESHPLNTLIMIGSGEDDYDAPSDPFVRDSGLTYVSRVLQRAAMDFGPGYTLRPRLREVSPDVLDMVSILSVCMKHYCAKLTTAAIKCARRSANPEESKKRILTTNHVSMALQDGGLE
eukprot:Gregarina_sp_Poly_1__10788@NODE_829_length_6100_cov_40_875849_g600_i0_p2_GENE_NODE_829_length_6100_cov_40_875849_g600_i0NODE_829_length_6100_cov_40_875849_g600_i0_p2_ORF_typecomplete_len473_score47_89_NODE_829_length_6100_cov_40_875849_g600_i038255243